ncbi:hypothetical protein [Vibrio nigripulchritudo]|uniref:hypothetical protein n=1 Tax=Vibrio nigripulchritudo TaxID=28173 RepID=UPI0003B2032D|nr:hypothetical protein [Vibrio nigripulchritudo]CCN70490.1 hypothetical protein VIBNISFn118_2190002 [Vibrio nigripulchritudo SFn118]
MRYLFPITSLFFLVGCGEIVVKDDCFEPLEINANYLFGSKNVRALPLGYGDEEESLRRHGIVGYIHEGSTYETLGSQDRLKFTGRVFKSIPSWAERYLGGSSEIIMFEAIYKDMDYVVFDFKLQNRKLPYPSENCSF